MKVKRLSCVYLAVSPPISTIRQTCPREVHRMNPIYNNHVFIDFFIKPRQAKKDGKRLQLDYMVRKRRVDLKFVSRLAGLRKKDFLDFSRTKTYFVF